MSEERTDSCPSCGAPFTGYYPDIQPPDEWWLITAFHSRTTCDYAAGLRAERDAMITEQRKAFVNMERAEALLHRVATTDITSSEWPTVMHEVRAWEAGDE